jgi:hypothetical protein
VDEAETQDWERGMTSLLSELMEAQFPFLLEGREERGFSDHPLMPRLTAAMKTPDSDEILESALDSLFADLRDGERFEHSEVVMALLFAMKSAKSSLFSELAEVLSQSDTAEIGQLRRFAKRLLTGAPPSTTRDPSCC